MTRSNLLAHWYLLGAVRHSARTARVEPAPRRGSKRARDLARDDLLAALGFRMRRQGGDEQCLGIGMQRVCTQLGAVGGLDDLAEVHHGDGG